MKLRSCIHSPDPETKKYSKRFRFLADAMAWFYDKNYLVLHVQFSSNDFNADGVSTFKIFLKVGIPSALELIMIVGLNSFCMKRHLKIGLIKNVSK